MPVDIGRCMPVDCWNTCSPAAIRRRAVLSSDTVARLQSFLKYTEQIHSNRDSVIERPIGPIRRFGGQHFPWGGLPGTGAFMRWEQQVKYASLSDVGFRRKNNQDAVTVHICSDREIWKRSGHLFIVADGMGGHAVGELASEIAVATLPHTFYKTRADDVREALRQAIEATNKTIHERGSLNHEFQRMGTTCSALLLSPQGAIIGHVGDSRVYRVRGDRIDQLTFDHSLQWELLRHGKVKPEEVLLHEPRHVITRSLGPEPEVEVDIEGPMPTFPGDVYVLCSDGLTGHVTDSEIGMVARELGPAEACRLLVNLANLRGGADNITVFVVRISDVPNGYPVEEVLDEAVEANDSTGLNWWWLAAMWGIAITLSVGILLKLTGMELGSAMITSLSVVAAGVALLGWMRKRRAEISAASSTDDLAKTQFARSYRTAPAKLSTRFLTHLATIETELQRAANDEGWAIDWEAHEKAFASAKSALHENHYPQALLEMGKAIDVLMAGLHQYRKQIVHERKWGKTPQPPNRPIVETPSEPAGEQSDQADQEAETA